ncbi:MAG: META domain-containing protein [Pseudomonadota bacterium]
MALKLTASAALAAMALTACARAEPPVSDEPAYLPEQVRQARAQAAEQAEKLAEITAGSAWTIVDISGQSMLDEAPASIAFLPETTVSGSAGCNSFNGAFTLDGAQIGFGPLATTRKLCPEPVMEQERFVLDTLGEVISAGVNEDGVLFLSTLNGDVIRLAVAGD